MLHSFYGLAIVRRIEKNLPGHTLRFSSKPGQGSRFSLFAPADSEPNVSFPVLDAGPSRTGDRLLKGKYIVVVEDERPILDSLVRGLREAGCLVEGVESAEAARRLFEERERCPDALVTDLSLRLGQTGLDAVAALRECFEWATNVPVLFITGELEPDAKLAGFVGVHSIYRKPINPDIVIARLCNLLVR